MATTRNTPAAEVENFCQATPARKLTANENLAVDFLLLWCEAKIANCDTSQAYFLAEQAKSELDSYLSWNTPMSPGFIEQGIRAYSDMVPVPSKLQKSYNSFWTKMETKSNKEYNGYQAAQLGLSLAAYLAS